VGVRADDRSLLELLRSRYQRWLVDDDRGDADLAISVSGDVACGVGQPLPALLHGRRPLLRSRHVDRLVHRLDLALGALQGHDKSGGLGLIGFGALVRSGRAVLVPVAVAEASGLIERAVASAGSFLAEPEGLRLDLGEGGLILPQGLTDWRWDLSPEPGRVRVVGIYWDPADRAEVSRPALVLGRLLAKVDDHRKASQNESLEALTRLVEVVPCTGLASGTRSDIDAVFATLLGR
jgi:hypothetical protein